MWSQTFDRNLMDVFQLQEDIAKSVADTLSVSLNVGVNARDSGGTDNPEAYASYVQGLSNSGNPDQGQRTGYLQRAVDLGVERIAQAIRAAGGNVPLRTVKSV